MVFSLIWRVSMSRTRFTLALLLVISALAVVLGVQATQSSGDAAAQQAILDVMHQQQSDWNRGDVRAFMQGYWNSPQLSFAGSTGFSRGWDAVLERYEHNYADKAAMGTLDFSELEVRPLNANAALVLGKWHLKLESGDTGGIFTLVFQKFPEGWKIVHDHTSVTAPQK
jgi:ketosteroid isomerase-like protein